MIFKICSIKSIFINKLRGGEKEENIIFMLSSLTSYMNSTLVEFFDNLIKYAY